MGGTREAENGHRIVTFDVDREPTPFRVTLLPLPRLQTRSLPTTAHAATNPADVVMPLPLRLCSISIIPLVGFHLPIMFCPSPAVTNLKVDVVLCPCCM